jgi:predicted cupin superfamily sugar epimerase
MNVRQLIQQFSLQPHPEGGWYKETYRSSELILASALPERFTGSRVFSTAIYFLLEQHNFSAFHRIKSDECWHFYCGDPLQIFILTSDGNLEVITLGDDILNGQLFQYTVPANSWFASRPAAGSGYCFVGCTVSPGFSFDDFEMADKLVLMAQHPDYKNIIHELCN